MTLLSGLLLAAGLAAAPVDFGRDIQPILRMRCLGCHNARQQTSGLRLDNPEHALKGGYAGVAIKPGDSGASRLYQMVTVGVTSDGKRVTMPPNAPLPPREAALLRDWIDQGARWPAPASTTAAGAARKKPWSFSPIVQPAVPAVIRRGWVRNPVDAFVLAKLEGLKVQPAPEASRNTLVRRVYLDVVGLPPTPSQVAAFLADSRPDAYEQLVDQLLRSPHYGEKWARVWLDAARYADSEGGVQDYVRPFAWRYRQWVIEALNQNMPFDQFVIEQVAGDLLPDATLEQKLATGFHRNTVTSREGGIDLEKLRYDQLVDRANTIGTAFLGLTVGCAQCHDHKYDPISQRDYYRLVAYFENGQELDIEAPLPGELGPYLEKAGRYETQRKELLEEYGVAGLQAEWEENLRDAAAQPGRRTDWDARFDSFSKLVDNGLRILLQPVASRTPRNRDAITNFFVRYAEGALGKKKYEETCLKELNQRLTALMAENPPLSHVMTLAEDTERKKPFLRLRGNYKDLGIEVAPGTPDSLPGLEKATPDRLGLARWLTMSTNPLTARVAVNRAWQELFGQGLVRTSDDFGMQGDKPTHPELLDWLASTFRAKGWNVKELHRLIVTSATYRQSSHAQPELAGHDPSNQWLARQTRFRLPAELIRDSALGVSGLLANKVGGESIRPPQPEGVVDQSYSLQWQETQGPDRYRRGLYVQTQRTALYPLLGNFDVPDRTVACARRESSNTPLQALNLLNDPVFAEAAQALAWRVMNEATGEAKRIDRAFLLCFARLPSPRERDHVASYLARRRALTPGNEAAAWTGLSRALLNSDEFISRE
ncbi:MAG: PSD1 domain-containing protein [Bryobacterales bacterium]|nr:PSD1 domain-containing protein [Bryobacterales bacterium]